MHARTGAFPGGRLHGDHDYKPGGGNGFFQFRGGKLLNGLVTAAFELQDTAANGGGFCCIKGSHKSHVALPAHYVDLAQQPIADAVTRVPAAPGDVIVFTESLM